MIPNRIATDTCTYNVLTKRANEGQCSDQRYGDSSMIDY